MPNASALALTGFIAWSLALLILMELARTWMVLRGQIRANGFVPDNANLSPFMQRLARAHANCLEGLPIFGGILVVALVTGRAGVTDALAPLLLIARIVQSVIHLVSVSSLAVRCRFTAFAVQMVIGVIWCYRMLLS